MAWVSYVRVSTAQQGESGLGLAAQKDVVLRFIGNEPLLAEFTEVASGKRHKNRPQLLAALELCKKKKAKLVIAKLDRLSRNVAFISSLWKAASISSAVITRTRIASCFICWRPSPSMSESRYRNA